MQIALTKKLAEAVGVKPAPADDSINPLFSWTANWTNTFDRRKEDMVVLVNNATRFTVIIYGVKRNQFQGITEKMTTAIRNTLLSMHLNPEIVDEYFLRAGGIEFASNHDRKLTAWVNRQGLDAAFVVGREINRSHTGVKYEDTFGRVVSRGIVNCGKNDSAAFYPSEVMIKALTSLTGKPVYKYRAFELLVTLDLEIYKATRRLIVPADLEFVQLNKVLQRVFNWKSCHLYDFVVFNGKIQEPDAHLVASGEVLSYDSNAILMTGHKLSEFMPENKFILYTYDMGDNWEHQIELVRVIDEYNAESPYLLEASGQAPPEDVGGVGGYIEFHEKILDPNHPEHEEMKNWAGYWSPQLREWDARPRIIHC